MCGENLIRLTIGLLSIGSPPRVRGKPYEAGQLDSVARITPACAGKTSKSSIEIVFKKDHPRVCGENDTTNWKNKPERGSPPRVRGKQNDPSAADGAIRITPACAGKTPICAVFSASLRDHPRVCGENLVETPLDPLASGSPPRVRGKLCSYLV